jgi:uncharacterized protein YbaA (DUF1428 family)
MAAVAGKVWREYGALDYKECVGDDLAVQFGQSFTKLARIKPGETVVFSWILYKSRAHRDRVNKKVMQDPRLTAMCDPKNPSFDMKRMTYGGFEVIVSAWAWPGIDRASTLRGRLDALLPELVNLAYLLERRSPMVAVVIILALLAVLVATDTSGGNWSASPLLNRIVACAAGKADGGQDEQDLQDGFVSMALSLSILSIRPKNHRPNE